MQTRARPVISCFRAAVLLALLVALALFLHFLRLRRAQPRQARLVHESSGCTALATGVLPAARVIVENVSFILFMNVRF